MALWRAVRVFLLSLVDALVPAAFAAGFVASLVTYDVLGPAGTLRWAGATGLVVYVGTIAFGLASAALRDRPFPVTRAVKRVVDWWPFLGLPWP